ncbi:FRG domain-containing protein [Flavobacterium psychrotolerans]|uniref:FRG domain-containing protein n=1 Tax=Flavobacterium psychrotolerans TaxID=2169410 RepID=A0A2U1JMU0_9FLAO|nr:FRG domain-containing protein [Flavobacterium psychrotolerans]PWA06178.1 hypothetical protein DB895_04575 [Flavobacterium psychrotolerans]
MKVYCASSYDEITKITFDLKCNFNDEILYRGTTNDLIPSIVQKCSYSTYEDLVVKEYLLLEGFKKYSHLKYKFKEGDNLEWEIRIAAREHGLASSLMDWSNSLDIAIEFAIYDFEAKNIDYTTIWILNKSKIKQISIPEKTINFNQITTPSIIQFTPYIESTYYKRKFIQGGFFLKQPFQDITNPLNLNSFYSDHLTQIIILKDAVGGIWKKIASNVDLDMPAMPVTNASDKTLDKICKALNENYA